MKKEKTTISKKDFDWIKWTKEDIKKVLSEYVKHKKTVYKEIKKIPLQERTFENTVLALEFSDGEFSKKMNYIHLVASLHPKKEMRDVATRAEEELAKKAVDVEYDKGIFDALVELKEKKPVLEGPNKKLFNDYWKAYQRMGFSLTAAKQKELKNLSKKIGQLVSRFNKNINDYKDSIVISEDEADGLSKNFLQTLEKNKKGQYIVSLDAAEYGTFISESSVAVKRKELIEKESKKGGTKNLKILQELLVLKNKRAKLLGYKNHATYVLEDRMAKKVDVVEKFLDTLAKKLYAPTHKEIDKVLERKKKETKKKNEKLFFYDTAYYASLLKKETYAIDPEKNREYFPLEHVLETIFDIFGNLFAVEFNIEKKKLWHKEVRWVVIVDKKTKKEIAYIAMDLFPREGKYGHLCVMDYRAGHWDSDNNQYIAPITALICNFRKATSKIPSLLSLGEVEGLLHEFGHAMHNSLGESKYPSQAGFNTIWDFVETPSQLLENWLFEERVLKKMTKHYKTAKAMPKKDRDNIMASEKFMNASFYSRQVVFGILDMILHTKGNKKPHKLYEKMVKETTGITLPKENLFPVRFTHIVGGYDAGYYSYLWALVYADDIFFEFKKQGIFNKSLGKKYRKEILSVGSERDEKISVEKFLGRKPNNKAFLKKLGIK